MKVLVPERLGRGVRVVATASHLPARRVTAEDLVALGAPLSVEEIRRLTGVEVRHWAAEGEGASHLAVHAARAALARAGRLPAEVSRLVLATVSPDRPLPSTACFVHGALGLGEAPAVDLAAACSGFVYALDHAARAVLTGDDVVLAVASEVRSRWVDLRDRGTCALFGDGAGAAVLEAGPVGEGLLAIGLFADGRGVETVTVPAGGSVRPASAATVAEGAHVIRMADGPEAYLAASQGMVEAGERVLAALGLGYGDVDLVVPHQANRRILERFARLARVPLEKVAIVVHETGNVSGATTALALDHALASGAVGAGAKVLVVAAGAGHTAGAALLKVDAALLARAGRAQSAGDAATPGGATGGATDGAGAASGPRT